MTYVVRHVMARFWALIDSESVKAFVWPYYVAFVAWGIYASFFALPNSVVEPVMGHWAYNFWVWLCIAGPASVMVGLALGGICDWANHKGLKCAVREQGEYVGLWMQLGGNLCAGLLLFAFEFSAIVGTPWARGSFILFILVPYILGCISLTLTTARKLWQIEKLQRRLERATR